MQRIQLPDIILASESPYRRLQMQGLGVAFQTAKPGINEEIEKTNFSDPQLMAIGLARLKALSLRGPNRTIIAGDQLIHLEGKILGKPLTRKQALEQLHFMQGRSHQILTALCVATEFNIIEHLDITTMTMRPLTLTEIEYYIDLDTPLDCAGSYKIEKNGSSLFSKIQTHDFSAIQGLPLLKLREILQTLGYATSKKE